MGTSGSGLRRGLPAAVVPHPILPARHEVDERTHPCDGEGSSKEQPCEIGRGHGVSFRRPSIARAAKCKPVPTKSQNRASAPASNGLVVPVTAAIDGAMAPTAMAAMAMPLSQVAVSFVRSFGMRLMG